MRRPLTKWTVRAACVVVLCGVAATLYPGTAEAIPAKPKEVWTFPQGDPIDDVYDRVSHTTSTGETISGIEVSSGSSFAAVQVEQITLTLAGVLQRLILVAMLK